MARRIILVVWCLSLLATPRVVNAAIVKISMTFYCQENSNWCWVATSKAVIKHHKGTAYSQCQVFKWGKGSPSSCPNETGTQSNISCALTGGGLTTPTLTNGTISYSTIKSEINASRPVMFRAAWKADNKKTAHMIIIFGHDDQGGDKKYMHMAEIQNCSTGTTIHKKRYSWGTDNDRWRWTDTVHGMK